MKKNWIFKIQAFFFLTRDYLSTENGYLPKSRWMKLKTLTSNFNRDKEHFEIKASKNDGDDNDNTLVSTKQHFDKKGVSF